MKGVSSVIAIILILMIVIALAALAYTWFSGIFASLTSTAGTAVTTTTGAMATQINMESSKCAANPCAASSIVDVTIRNIGTQNINASTASIALFQDGVIQTSFSGSQPVTCTVCSGTCPGTGCTLLPGGVAEYKYVASVAATCGTSIIKVSIGTGLQNSEALTC
jgi:flagellin-like protein